MSQQRVLLLGRPGLLAQGVRDILEREGRKVLGPLSAAEEFQAHVVAFGPDAVVIADEDDGHGELVARVLRTHPDLLVVRIGLEENVVRVYRSEQVAATSAGLLDALRELPAGPPRGHSVSAHRQVVGEVDS